MHSSDTVDHPFRSIGTESARRIPELDGLRTIAVILVIGCHYPSFATSLEGLPQLGWMGVDIFFVLSGFLITSILLRARGARDAYFAFLTRRGKRILPPYLVAIGLALIWSTGNHNLDLADYADTIRSHLFFGTSLDGIGHYAASIGQLLTGHSHLSSLFQSVSELPPPRNGLVPANFTQSLSHLWSVSVEEWYYVLWAPAVLLCRRRTAIVTAVLLIVTAFIARWAGFRDEQWVFNFLCRIDTLSFGALLAFLHAANPDNAWARRVRQSLFCLSPLSAGALVALLWSIRPVLSREVRANTLFAVFGPPLLAMSATGLLHLIISPGFGARTLRFMLANRAMVYLGRRSYMIYLIHVPAYYIASRFLGKYGSVTAAAALSVTFLVAVVSWRFMECPLLGARDQKPKGADLNHGLEMSPLLDATSSS